MSDEQSALNRHQDTAWHNLEYEAAFMRFDSSVEGLDTGEAELRFDRYGYNRLRRQKQKSPLKRFIEQFHNVLIYVLLGAAVVTMLLGHLIDSGVILGVVLINALIGFIQEGKAEKALDAIRDMLSPQAMVKRDGHFVSISAEELVPGDVVMLQSGDKVPADLRLFRQRELRIEEAILTGESMPVEKDIAPVQEQASIGDRKSIAYSGTLVTYGQGQGVVVATGDHTEIGRISKLLSEVQTLTTPLMQQIAVFARWLTIIILVVATSTFIFGALVHDYSMNEMFLAAVGLAVAGIPEGLPAIMTITLAIGVQRMARKHAIIRRLPAVETLGSITVICSDKTGTLTRNEMTVQSLATDDGVYEVSGVGYDPHGTISLDGRDLDMSVDQYPRLKELASAALLCNDATLTEQDGLWGIHGDPTEGALLTLAAKAGLDHESTRVAYPRTDAIPFESQHRFMASLHHDREERGYIYIKGAPEQVMDMCTWQRTHGEDAELDRAAWEATMADVAGRGQRLLAIAAKSSSAEQRSLNFSDMQNGFTLLGVVGIIDPPREEAIQSVRTCQSAGIRVKMITGDHAATARAIGKQMGIGDGETSVQGSQLKGMDEQQLRNMVHDSDIFARVSPEEKLQLVTIIQGMGDVVAMTGDGVNDAPALKRADVGIAMGRKGTEVAKEASEMVITDDNFASIGRAVEEGRTVYDNLKKSILFILPTNGGEALTIIAAIALGRTLPITAVQILWVNMITAVTLALALAFEPAEADVMKRPPRDHSAPLLSRFLIWRIVFVSLILVTGTFGMFVWERNQGADILLAQTVAVNTLVMYEIFYLLSARYLLAPALTAEGLTGNRLVLYSIVILLVFQMAFTYVPVMQQLFGTVPLDTDHWMRIVLVASSVLVLVELEKWWLRSRRFTA